MPNKKYTVIVSDRAASMLVNHVRFLARVSPEAAKKLHKEIIAETKALEVRKMAKAKQFPLRAILEKL